MDDFVKQGPCHVDCYSSFILFVCVQVFIQFIGCSGRITTVLVNYRSVEKRDKSIAQGLALFMISLLAFIPGPIIFGRIIGTFLAALKILKCNYNTILSFYRCYLPGLGQ